MGGPGATLAQKVEYLSAKTLKVPLKCQFCEVFLRVTLSLYCKNQADLLPGSVSAASVGSWAPLKQHRENPSVQALFGELKAASF